MNRLVKHVILWKLKEEYTALEKQEIAQNAKKALERLKGKIPGLVDIFVRTVCLASSNADMMLDSTFDSEESLRAYAVHPEHVAAANTFVRPYTAARSCFDYEA